MKPANPSLLLVAAIVVGLAAGGAAAKKQYTTAASAEDFEKILAPLNQQGQAYAARGGDAGPAPSRQMETIQYSDASAKELNKALRTRSRDPLADMYVAWQLLQPLHMAGNELLVQLRPAMVELLGMCQYQKMPEWPRSMLDTLAPSRRKAPPSIERLRQQRRDAALAKKRQAEQAVVKNNRMAHALEETLKSLLVLMGDEEADKAMLDRFRSEVDMKWTTYAHTLDAVRGQAVHMKKDQAKLYYDALLDVVGEHPAPSEHADPTRPSYSDTANSSFQTKRLDLPTETLKVVNLLATASGEPAVIVKPGKKPPRRGRDPRGRRR